LALALSKTTFDCTNLGSNTVTLTVTDGSSNASTCTATVTVVHDSPPTSASVNRNNICASDGNIILTYSGGILGAGSVPEWYSDAGFSIHIGTGNNLLIASPSGSTTYYVRFEGVCGNSASVNISENINALPIPAIIGATEVCDPSTELYSTSFVSGHSYSWIVTGGTISGAADGNSVLVDWLGIGTGTVQVTEIIDSTGCQEITPLYNVNIFDIPVLPDINSDNKLIRR